MEDVPEKKHRLDFLYDECNTAEDYVTRVRFFQTELFGHSGTIDVSDMIELNKGPGLGTIRNQPTYTKEAQELDDYLFNGWDSDYFDEDNT